MVNVPSLETFKAMLDREGSEQPAVVNVSAHCRAVGLEELERAVPTQTVLGSMPHAPQ